MIVFPVKIFKLFIGQIWYFFRVTARIKTVGIVRKEGVLTGTVKNTFRRRTSTFHFIKHNPFTGQWRIHIFQFIVPAFLLEDKG